MAKIKYIREALAKLEQIQKETNDIGVPDDVRETIKSLATECGEIIQAGYMVTAGNTFKAFQIRTGLSADQIKETDFYKQFEKLHIGESAVLTCNNVWYAYARAIIKATNRNLKYRGRKMSDTQMLVTRLA